MATWTVKPAGGDYDSIADAVSNASTNSNDIIAVDPGTYSPTGTIGRSELTNITISGTNEDATQVIINASNISAAAAISASAGNGTPDSGWTLKNFSVHNSTVGVLTVGAIQLGISSSVENVFISGSNGEGFGAIESFSTINRCKVTGCSGSAIVTRSGAGVDNAAVTVKSCLIHDTGAATAVGQIVLYGSGTVLHNTIVKCTGGYGVTLQGSGGRIEHNIVAKLSQTGANTRSGFYTLDSSGITTSYNLSYGHTNGGTDPDYNLAAPLGTGDEDSGSVPDQNTVFVDEDNYDFTLHDSSPAKLASTGTAETAIRDFNNKRFVFHSASKGCYEITGVTAPTWTTDPPTITSNEGVASLTIDWTAATDDIHDDNVEYKLEVIDKDDATVQELNILAPTLSTTITSLGSGEQYKVIITPIDAAENTGSGYSVTASTARGWTTAEGGNNAKTSIPDPDYVITSISLDRSQRDTDSSYDSTSSSGITPLGFTRRGSLSLRRFGIPYSCSFGG